MPKRNAATSERTPHKDKPTPKAGAPSPIAALNHSPHVQAQLAEAIARRSKINRQRRASSKRLESDEQAAKKEAEKVKRQEVAALKRLTKAFPSGPLSANVSLSDVAAAVGLEEGDITMTGSGDTFTVESVMRDVAAKAHAAGGVDTEAVREAAVQLLELAHSLGESEEEDDPMAAGGEEAGDHEPKGADDSGGSGTDGGGEDEELEPREATNTAAGSKRHRGPSSARKGRRKGHKRARRSRSSSRSTSSSSSNDDSGSSSSGSGTYRSDESSEDESGGEWCVTAERSSIAPFAMTKDPKKARKTLGNNVKALISSMPLPLPVRTYFNHLRKTADPDHETQALFGEGILTSTLPRLAEQGVGGYDKLGVLLGSFVKFGRGGDPLASLLGDVSKPRGLLDIHELPLVCFLVHEGMIGLQPDVRGKWFFSASKARISKLLPLSINAISQEELRALIEAYMVGIATKASVRPAQDLINDQAMSLINWVSQLEVLATSKLYLAVSDPRVAAAVTRMLALSVIHGVMILQPSARLWDAVAAATAGDMSVVGAPPPPQLLTAAAPSGRSGSAQVGGVKATLPPKVTTAPEVEGDGKRQQPTDTKPKPSSTRRRAYADEHPDKVWEKDWCLSCGSTSHYLIKCPARVNPSRYIKKGQCWNTGSERGTSSSGHDGKGNSLGPEGKGE